MTPRPIRRFDRVVSAICGRGYLVDLDDVVEEPDGGRDDPGEPLPVEGPGLGGVEEVRDVDRAEVAGFVGMERLFAAGIGRPDRAEASGRIAPVDPVDEDEPGIAHRPGRFDEETEDLARFLRPVLPALVRVADGVGAVLLQGAHELVGHGDGDVEVGQAPAVPLHGDELLDVRVVDPQDADIGAPPGPALLDGLGRGVDDPEERDRARGDALGLADEASPGPERAEIEAGPAAFLVDEGRVLDRVEDGVHRILDGQDEAGAEAHAAPGPGQGRAVGEEVPVHHDLEESVGPAAPFGRALFGPGDEPGDAPEKVGRRRVQEPALVVLQVIAGLQDPDGVGRESLFVVGPGHHI